MNISLTITRTPWWSAWRHFGWKRGTWGIGINNQIINNAIRNNSGRIVIKLNHFGSCYTFDPHLCWDVFSSQIIVPCSALTAV